MGVSKLVNTSAEDSAVIPLNDFGLSWRWEDAPGYPDLPIQPLWDSIVERLWNLKLTFVDKSRDDYRPNPNMFRTIVEISTDTEPSKIEDWLRQTIPSDSVRVFISWDNHLAVLTTVDFLCRFWDDFCYPSSDDVLILPLTGDWIIHYWHEEVMWFAMP